MSERANWYMFACLACAITVQNVSVALGNIFLVISLIFFVYLLYKNKKNIAVQDLYKPYVKAMLIFFLSTLPSALLVSDIKIGSKAFMELWVYRSLPFFMIILFVKNTDYIKKVLLWISPVICLYNFCALINFVVPPPHTLFARTNFLAEPYRTSLPYACIMCELVAILLVLIYDEYFSNTTKKIAAISLIFALIAIVCGESRGAWVVTFITTVSISLLYFKKTWKKIIIFALICLCITAVISGNHRLKDRFCSIINISTNRSNTDRIEVWKICGTMIKENPVLGIGLGQFKSVYHNKYWKPAETQKLPHAHNNLLHITVENGMIGGIGFLFFILLFYRMAFKDWIKTKNPYTLMILGAFSNMMLYGLIEYTFDSTIAMKTFWFGLGILLVLRFNTKKE